MAAEKTEEREIRRGDGKLVVKVTYTPRTGRPIRMFHLRLEVDATKTEGCSPNVFVFQRATVGKPMEDGSPRDEFIGVADALDEDEIPVDEPDLARNVPYYRVKDVELLFRNSDIMYETAAAILTDMLTYTSDGLSCQEVSKGLPRA